MLTEAYEIFRDPAHILAEVGWEFCTFVIIAYPVKKLNDAWHRKHDKEVHDGSRFR